MIGLDVRLAEQTIEPQELKALADWLVTSPQLTKGALTQEFESSFSRYIGSRHAVFVNSGSSANLLMIYALLEGNYLKNRRVVVPAISWITTLSPVIQLGMEPILCEADSDDLGLDLDYFEHLCKAKNPGLAIVVHVLGHPNKMQEILSIAAKYSVIVIEDACEALGTSQDDKRTGNIGIAGSFSFYYGHHISTIEGGMVTTSDPNLYNIMLSIRSHGWARDVEPSFKTSWSKGFDIDEFRDLYTFFYPGFNLRSTDLNAFIGLTQMQKLDRIVASRKGNFDRYRRALGSDYWVQNSRHDTLSSFAYGTFVQNRLDVFKYLKREGIETRPLICGSMGRQPFWIRRFGIVRLPVADAVHDFGIYLPNHLMLDQSKIEMVCEAFKSVAVPLADNSRRSHE